MNFIYSILLFLIISLTSFGLSTQVEPIGNWHEFYIGLSVISSLTTLIFIICMVFRQMEFTKEIREKISSIRAYRENINLKLNDLKRYKDELKDSLTKVYPDYEKELFKGMNQSDSEYLSAILVKYPELQFNGILTEYTNGIKHRLKAISELESDIIYKKRDLEDINMSGWKFGRTLLPSDI